MTGELDDVTEGCEGSENVVVWTWFENGGWSEEVMLYQTRRKDQYFVGWCCKLQGYEN